MAVEYIYLFWAYSIPKLSTQIHKEGVFNEELPDFINGIFEAEGFSSLLSVFLVCFSASRGTSVSGLVGTDFDLSSGAICWGPVILAAYETLVLV
ncbi:hypothetical protein TNCT_346741 [Trichonephila clavata]|uniref:Uncharacterized protein n=1 Tax=Trichonephila clavata TaxID=2740835 RepID=A0A8X6J7G6_TRICU|nr:hypothetical protein TNCT_346741 [Trichonephila clavata]